MTNTSIEQQLTAGLDLEMPGYLALLDKGLVCCIRHLFLLQPAVDEFSRFILRERDPCSDGHRHRRRCWRQREHWPGISHDGNFRLNSTHRQGGSAVGRCATESPRSLAA